MRRVRYPLHVTSALAAALALSASPVRAQDADELARREWNTARAFAVDGKADSALAHYAAARRYANQAGDQLIAAAALRGAAQVHAVYIGCGDSATMLFREAIARSGPGDRRSADAFVRYLAARGRTDEAQQLLNETYSSVEGLGRTITRESMNWYQGMAAIQRATGKESAALASLTSALSIAARLRTGDVTDSAPPPTTEVDPVNYWVVYDLAQLRLHAKAPSVASQAVGKRLMDALVRAGIGHDERDDERIPVARLLDTRTILAHQCTMTGGSCPAPTLAKCPTGR